MLPHACHISCPSHSHSFVLPKTEVKNVVCHCAVLTRPCYFPTVLIPYTVLSTLFSHTLFLTFFS
jgi:hypothetical protein